MSTIGFIGMGNMGYAILKGVCNEFEKKEIIFHRKSKDKMKELSKKESIPYGETNMDVVKEAKYIILAIKPQMFESVLSEIKKDFDSETIVISLAPGFSINELEKMTGIKKIVRCMPNTPAMVGEGMTGISYNCEFFSNEEKNIIKKIFKSFGKMEIVNENMMNSVVCASGSSPAYVFMFIEALADSAVKCGLPREKAYNFVAQTVLGSAKLMLETGKHPGELKDMVCSPGGTTIAGVEELEKNGFRKSIFAATDACFDKCNKIK